MCDSLIGRVAREEIASQIDFEIYIDALALVHELLTSRL